MLIQMICVQFRFTGVGEPGLKSVNGVTYILKMSKWPFSFRALRCRMLHMVKRTNITGLIITKPPCMIFMLPSHIDFGHMNVSLNLEAASEYSVCYNVLPPHTLYPRCM